jgi:tetratricopeptide (TPR) repeat protein
MTAQSYKTLVLDLLQQGRRDEAAWVQELDETERAAIGKPDFWSAKDHVAHMTFWRQNLVREVTATLHQQEIPPSEEDEDQINARVVEEHRLRPWAEMYAESEQTHADLLQLIEHLSEADLTNPHRFPALTGGWPLYAIFLGTRYEHEQEHLVQYYADRHDLARAIELRERCAARVLQAEVPERVKASFLYNLACFYAQQRQREQAAARLQEAVALDPDLKEQSESDADLAALRDHSA